MSRPRDEAFKQAARQKLTALKDAAVPLWSHVQNVADGAFVECVIWVSDAEAAKAEKPHA